MIKLYAKDGTKVDIDPELITEIKSIGNGSELYYDGKVVLVYEAPTRIERIISRSEKCQV